MKKVMFVGRYSAETCGPWPDFALISLNETGASDGDAVIQEGWHDVLRLSFHDITALKPGEDYTLFNEEQSKQIVEFVKKVAPVAEGIIVHCRAGISRSAAVAKWICSQYHIPFNAHYYKYNDFIFQLLVIAGQENDDSKEK